MTRLEALKIKVQQYPYQKSARKLTEGEFDTLVAFIEDHEHLGHLEFEYAVNRMFLNREKSKNWVIMTELLMVSNSAAHGRTK